MTTWTPGDLALCRVNGPWFANVDFFGLPAAMVISGPRSGQIDTVRVVSFLRCDGARCQGPCEGHTMLTLERWDPKMFDASGFVKISPDCEVEGREVEQRLPAGQSELVEDMINFKKAGLIP